MARESILVMVAHAQHLVEHGVMVANEGVMVRFCNLSSKPFHGIADVENDAVILHIGVVSVGSTLTRERGDEVAAQEVLEVKRQMISKLLRHRQCREGQHQQEGKPHAGHGGGGGVDRYAVEGRQTRW